jgi:ACS family D-galactonate transporter-like MFS transporter
MLGTKIGPAIGAPLAAWLITLYDWHLMFIIVGLAGLVWLAPWLLMVKNDRPTAAAIGAEKTRAATLPLRNILIQPGGLGQHHHQLLLQLLSSSTA